VVALSVAVVGALIVVTTWDPTGYTFHDRIEAAVARALDKERQADLPGSERLLLDALAIDAKSPRARSAYGAFPQRHGRGIEARAFSWAP
jgi:hypothetical protein